MPARAATSPTVSIGDVSVVEGGASPRVANLAVTLSEPATTTVTVEYNVVGGTATKTVDYSVPGRTLVFRPDASGFTPVMKYVRVSVRAESYIEGDETVIVRLSNPTSGYAPGRSDGTAVIINDDWAPSTEVSIGDATIVEGDVGMRVMRFPVTLTGPSAQAVFVTWSIDSVTATCATVTKKQATVADQDCGVLTNLVHPANVLNPLFPLGPAPPRTGIHRPTGVSKSIDFAIFPDVRPEGDETFTVTISSSNAVRRAVATGRIIDDD